jgi:1-acyl-sn-glycerol-3-phosphate acyltransferase
MAVLRGLGRLARVLVHLLHALWVARRLPHVDEAGRQARIRWFAQGTLRALGVRWQVQGTFRPGAKLVVANHVSWLDIVALHAACPEVRFVSKADVLHWPVLGWLIKVAGTLFIVREKRSDSMRVLHEMSSALQAGQSVAVFPEGTTSDGRQVLPFHAGLLQSAIACGTPIQPVALRYSDDAEPISRAAAYIDEVNLIQSAWRIASARGLTVHVTALTATGTHHADRRALARRLHGELCDALGVDPAAAPAAGHAAAQPAEGAGLPSR